MRVYEYENMQDLKIIICENTDLLYIYIYIYIRGAFNKFLDFFVQTFKIVVDSGKIYYVITIHLMR